MRLPALTYAGARLVHLAAPPGPQPGLVSVVSILTHRPAVLCLSAARRAWIGSTCRPGVALSRKGAKSDTRGRKLRSTGTRATTRDQVRNSRADLERRLETYKRELAEARGHLSEALEQQSATSEVLQVISSSPGELEMVFQPMLANAIKLCEASYGAMWLREGDSFR